MGRAPCCDKANVKKGPWSPEEDAKLKSYIEQHGTGGNWIALPQKIGLKRCGKSCRLRWLNYLRPNLKHGGFSEEEDNIICSLYIAIGSRWSIIAAQLPGRTDNDIKNYWNTRLKKKLLGKHRKDQQQAHRDAKKAKASAPVEVANDGNCHQDTYWPEPTMPVNPISQLDRHVIDEQASIRKFLIRLGGRFGSDQLIYGNSVNQMATFVDAGSFSDGSSTLGGQFSAELIEMLYCNSKGLDGFYGLTSGSMIWSDTSPLINPPAASIRYRPMQQQYCLHDEPVHLGAQ